MDITLLPCECVAGMTIPYQLTYIYEAMRQLAGSPADLPTAECVLAAPLDGQLSFIYCAALAWANS